MSALVYVTVILSAQSCLYDNYDKAVFGICWECDWMFELKDRAAIILVVLFISVAFLGRHVSNIININVVYFIVV